MASVITIAGEQLFAAKAQANEQLDIDTFIFANVPNQDPSAPINREEGIPTANIVYQQNVQQVGRINDNVVVYSTVLDSITGPFEFNWVGLYSSVNQKLVAINHVPTVTKTATAPGAAGNTLNRNFGIEYSGIADLTGINVEPETWQLDFTARLSGMDLLTQQLAADMNGKDWFIADGLKVVPRTTANTFSVTPGVGYVSGLRVELKQEHILIVQSYPQFVYVDAWFSGNANSTWSPQLAFTVTNTEMDDYIDPSGTQHYVYKLAIVNDADDVEDLRLANAINNLTNSRRETTSSELKSGGFLVGSKLTITDRSHAVIDVVEANDHVVDDQKVLSAGSGKVGILKTNKGAEYPLSIFGIKPSPEGQSNSIQTAMEICAENNVTLLIDGEYWVEGRDLIMDDGVLVRHTCLYIPNNSKIKFLPGAKIKQVPNNKAMTYVLNFYLKDNITILYPEVHGDKDQHTGTDGEYGHCYNITSCSKITLIKPKAYNAWGDGYYVGLEYWSATSRHLEELKIEDAEYDNISRNGLSFTSGKNVNITVLSGGAVSRVFPMAGVDIEPEIGTSSPIKPTFENCNLWLNTSNSLSGLLIYIGGESILEKCDITIHELNSKNDTTPLQVEKRAISLISGLIRIIKFTSIKSRSSPVYIKWAKDNFNLLCDKSVFNESNYDGPTENPQDSSFIIVQPNAGVVAGGFYFDEITRVNCKKTPLAYRTLANNMSEVRLSFKDFDLSNSQSRSASSGRLEVDTDIKGYATITYYNVNSKDNAFSKIRLKPSTADGITINLSDLIGFEQLYTKVVNNNLPIIFKPSDGKFLYVDGVSVSTAKSNSQGASCRIIDLGDGNKMLIKISGSWVTS
ncbi:phage tail protein [Shewanella oncorhynchi]|uniref:phage tail-collar fiber domain-containing protein n=1 Tax=Shewanella oncorhynchi TaxID=2726434 RepID=UPI003D7AA8AC